MARSWRWFAGFLMLIAAIVPLAPADAGQPPGARIEISFPSGPMVPFEPFTAELTVTGCPPDVDASIELVRFDVVSDTGGFLRPARQATVTTDVDGAASVTFDAVAYPGTWRYNVSCVSTGDYQTFELEPPASYVITADRTTLAIDVASTMTVFGTGCMGYQANWEIAAHPLGWAFARADVADDGTWSASAPVLIPADDADFFRNNPIHAGRVPVRAYCTMSTDEGVVRVFYPILYLQLDDAPPTTEGPDAAGAGAVAPRFTG